MADLYVNNQGGATPTSPYATWATAAATITIALADAACVAGSNVYVAFSHAESGGNALINPVDVNTKSNPICIISVDETGSPEPPTTGDYKKATSAQVTAVGGGDVIFSATDIGVSLYGLWLTAEDNLNLSGIGTRIYFSDCTLEFDQGIGTNQEQHHTYEDVTFIFENVAAAGMAFNNNSVYNLFNCSASSTTATRVVYNVAGASRGNLDINIDGFDATGMTAGSFEFCADAAIGGNANENVTLNCSNIILPTGGTWGNTLITGSGSTISLSNVTAEPSGNNITHTEFRTFNGTAISNTSIYLNADDGEGTGYSMEFQGSANAKTGRLETGSVKFLLDEFYSTANPTVEIHAYGDHATALTAQEFWITVEYPDATNRVSTHVVRDIDVDLFLGSGTALATETDPGWVGTGSPTNPRYYNPSVTISGGGAGVHRVWASAAIGAGTSIWVDPITERT